MSKEWFSIIEHSVPYFFAIFMGCHWLLMAECSEWCLNEGNFWWRRFWSPPSLGHPCHFESLWNVYFVILWSFKYRMTSEWRRWCWNDNFLILGWWLMTWMRVEWGNFWSKANALDFFLRHFTLIWTIFYHLTLIALKNLGTCAVSLGEMTLNDIRKSIHSKILEYVLSH